MSIKKRRKIKVRKRPPSASKNLDRMGSLLEAGHGDQADAEAYFSAFDKAMLARLQSIAAIAEEKRSWEFMEGCYKQATELYVLASVLYEKFPEHTILSDGAFDALSRFMLKHRKHMDKDFLKWYAVTAMGLKASSGYNVAVRKPIPQYVYLITGKQIEEDDDAATQNRSRVLRRKPKPRGKRGTSSKREKAGRIVRKSKRVRKPD